MKSNLSKHRGIINHKTLLATVDLGKHKNSGYCRCPNGNEINCLEFENNRIGFNKFWNTLLLMKKKHQLNQIIVGFESTGPYGEPLIHFLNKKELRLVQVNCTHSKRVKELYDNSPNKTDIKDPNVIADLIELGRFLSVPIPEGQAAELRRLMQGRERMLARYKSLYNQLHDLVFLLFPEFLTVMSLHTKSAKYLLKHYPAPGDIVELGLPELTTVLKKVSHKRIGKDHAQKLYTAAQTSVGLRSGQRAITNEIKQILILMNQCEAFIYQIEQQLSKNLKEVAYSRYLFSIKGLSTVTIAGLIGEVGDFSNFKTISELMKYSGLNLYEISSGYHRGRRRISKRGRSLLRKILYFAALNVVKKGGILHHQYQNYLQRGMVKLKALIAISRKLLAIIFALVRDRSYYSTASLPMLNKQVA